MVTNLSTKGTKVVIKGGNKARENYTRVAINGMTIAQRIVVAIHLQIMVKNLLKNINLPKHIHLPHPHRL